MAVSPFAPGKNAKTQKTREGSERFKTHDNIAYIAYNLHFDMKTPGRRASVRTRNFRRFLSDADAAILAAAGHGDMSAGFKNLLAAYQKLYSCGLITLDDIDCHLDKYAQSNISNGTNKPIR